MVTCPTAERRTCSVFQVTESIIILYILYTEYAENMDSQMHDKYSQNNLDLVYIKSISNGYYVRCDCITSFYVIKWVAQSLVNNTLRPPKSNSLPTRALQYLATLKSLIIQLGKQALRMRKHFTSASNSYNLPLTTLQQRSIAPLNEISPTTPPVWVNTSTVIQRMS